MESLIWIGLFVGLMFVMHRFGMGCCGGHRGSHHEEKPGEKGEGEGKPKASKGCH